MRLAIFVWGAGQGAFANVAGALATGFIQAGVDVDILYVHGTPAEEGPFPAEAHVLHVEASRASLSMRALAKYLQARQPDALVSLGWLMNMPAILAKTLSNWRGALLLYEAGIMSYEAAVEHRANLRLRIIPFLARHLYRRSDGLVVPSRAVLDDLGKTTGVLETPLAIRVIRNPVDVAAIQRRAREEVDDPDLLSGSRPLILGVGRLAAQKNFELLIAAFAKLRQRRKARLLILGEGPQRSRLEALALSTGLGEDISLPGAVGNPSAYMRRADVLVLPSKSEGFGLVLVEAMAVGCPVVATRSGGPEEVIQEGVSGILTSPGDPDEMAVALGELFDDGQLARRMGKAGIDRARQFLPGLVASEWLSFIAGLSRRGRSATGGVVETA